jgi:hypothetical protein
MWPIEFIKKLFTRHNHKSYFQEHPSLSHMIRVKCINPECSAPDKIFEFDERSVGAIGPAKPNEEGAAWYIITCPFCGTRNKISLKKKDESVSLRRSIGISRQPPREIDSPGFVDVAF